MWCPASTLYVFILFIATDARRSAVGPRSRHEATEDEICSGNSHFTCQDGECVPMTNAECDGVIHCQDGSDEKSCSRSSGCILPPQPTGGSYQLTSCSGNGCNVVPGMLVPDDSFLTYKCDAGYIHRGNLISFCLNNAWYLPPSCIKTCPALSSDSVDFECRYDGAKVSCEDEILPGTKATMACKYLYKIPLGNEPWYLALNCLDGGVWDRTSFNCIPECGKAVSSGSPAIVNGIPPGMPGRFPWHVAIYSKSDTGNFELKCSGTLVSPDLVISVAHCFYDDTVRKLQDASRFAVVAGKYYRDYNATNDSYAQKSTIKRIDLPERYVGAIQNFAQDIALVRLHTRLNMTQFVMPVCIDWHNEYVEEHLRNGQLGKVMGWGRTAAEDYSPILQAINLPYVEFQNCIDAAPQGFDAYITADKFCAGYMNGSSVCDGDSGGGLCFENQSGTWVLRGIVSVSPVKNGSCDTNYYAAFTNVKSHMELIRHAFETRLERDPKIVHRKTCDLLHTCRNKECVQPADARCDGIVQCQDGSDELNCATGGCILPEPPTGGSFELRSCEGQRNAVSGTRVPTGSFLIYRWDDGYICKGNNVSVCNDNAWFPPPTCITPIKVTVAAGKGPFLKGSQFSISCHVVGYPTPKVIWYKDDSRIRASNRIRISGNVLIISAAEKNDTGKYRCEAANEYTSSAETVDIRVVEKVSGKYCPALRSESVDFDCKYHNKTVSCQSAIAPWTRVTLACKNFYKLPVANNAGYGEITCLENGAWSRPVFDCTFECGTEIANKTQLIGNGSNVPDGRFPWFVRIYRIDSTESVSTIYKGTLISPNLVLSLGFWFYDKTLQKAVNARDYIVFAGTYSTLRPYAQKSLVKKINIATNYQGKQGNYADNAALIHVETPFTMTTLVRPICIDWENEFELKQLQSMKDARKVYGVVFKLQLQTGGWGNQEMNLTYFSREECLSRLSDRYEIYFKGDTFCVPCSKGSATCTDKTFPSALYYESHGIWYLLGVARMNLLNHDGQRFLAVYEHGQYLDRIRAALLTAF